MTGVICPSYRSGFASPQRNRSRLKYPRLWDDCVVAWSPCLGATGTRLYDQSGYGNHGTLTNMAPATDWTPSEGKMALDFDGVNDYVTTANAVEISAGQSFSVSAWVRLIADGFYPMVVAYKASTAIYDMNLRFDASTRAPAFHIGNSAQVVAISPDAVSLNSWNFLAGVFDGSAGYLYVNGVLKSTDSTIGSGFYGFTSSTGTGFDFGRRYDGFYLNGQLDDIRIYNRAITPAEIKTLATRRGIAYETKRVHRGYVATVASRRRNFAWSGW